MKKDCLQVCLGMIGLNEIAIEMKYIACESRHTSSCHLSPPTENSIAAEASNTMQYLGHFDVHLISGSSKDTMLFLS